jgi:hypothetical protein
MKLSKLFIPILLLPLLSGCASFSLFGKRVQPVEVKTVAVERTPLNLRDPAPLEPRVPQWIIITPENADKIWADLEAKKSNLVLIALTDRGYEELAVTMVEIRNFINMQRQIIIKYREYYEPEKEEQKK